MIILIKGTDDISFASGCCGGAYDYDNDSNCIENSD